MRTRFVLSSALVVLLVTGLARAERPPESRDKADLVVAGKVLKIATKKSRFGADGERTDYTATVEVTKLESGNDAKVGDKLTVTWFRVTKSPSKAFPGAYGQDHRLAAKDEAKFWLMKGKDAWTIIYNQQGVEKLKKD